MDRPTAVRPDGQPCRAARIKLLLQEITNPQYERGENNHYQYTNSAFAFRHCELFSRHYAANTSHRSNVWPVLGRRRRRWANIGPAFGPCVVFAGYPVNRNIDPMLVYWWQWANGESAVDQCFMLVETTLFLIVVLSATKPLSLKELTLPPFTLFPHPVPEECYNKAYQVQQSYNLLYHKVAHDYQFLESALSKWVDLNFNFHYHKII